MSTHSFHRLLPFAAAALLSLSAAQSALADEGEQTYRRVVLGESPLSTAAAPAAAASADVQLGSYARYLIQHLGMSTDQAIAQARTAGERVGFATVTHESPVSIGRAAYERFLGNDPVADVRAVQRKG